MDRERVIGTLLLLGWTNETGGWSPGNDVVHFHAPKGGTLYFYPNRYETQRGTWAACRKWFRALRKGDVFEGRFDTDSLEDAIKRLERETMTSDELLARMLMLGMLDMHVYTAKWAIHGMQAGAKKLPRVYYYPRGHIDHRMNYSVYLSNKPNRIATNDPEVVWEKVIAEILERDNGYSKCK